MTAHNFTYATSKQSKNKIKSVLTSNRSNKFIFCVFRRPHKKNMEFFAYAIKMSFDATGTIFSIFRTQLCLNLFSKFGGAVCVQPMTSAISSFAFIAFFPPLCSQFFFYSSFVFLFSCCYSLMAYHSRSSRTYTTHTNVSYLCVCFLLLAFAEERFAPIV